MERFRPLLMILVRYMISGAGVWLAARGFPATGIEMLNNEVTPLVVGAIVFYAPQVYALYVRPSFKAMKAAAEIDKSVPVDAPVVIKTPVGEPDIIVAPAGRD